MALRIVEGMTSSNRPTRATGPPAASKARASSSFPGATSALRGAARLRREESRHPAGAVKLCPALDRNQRHPERPLHPPGRHAALHDELAGNHPKARHVALRAGEHPQLPVKRDDLAGVAPTRQVRVEFHRSGGDTGNCIYDIPLSVPLRRGPPAFTLARSLFRSKSAVPLRWQVRKSEARRWRSSPVASRRPTRRFVLPSKRRGVRSRRRTPVRRDSYLVSAPAPCPHPNTPAHARGEAKMTKLSARTPKTCRKRTENGGAPTALCGRRA